MNIDRNTVKRALKLGNIIINIFTDHATFGHNQISAKHIKKKKKKCKSLLKKKM